MSWLPVAIVSLKTYITNISLNKCFIYHWSGSLYLLLFGFELQPLVPRAYSDFVLRDQSLLVGLRDKMGCSRLKLGKQHAKQMSYHLYNFSDPSYFLFFKKIINTMSIGPSPSYIPINSTHGLLFSTTFGVSGLFDISHFHRCEVIFHYDFGLYPLIISVMTIFHQPS